MMNTPSLVIQILPLTCGDSLFAKTMALSDRLQANFTIAASLICQKSLLMLHTTNSETGSLAGASSIRALCLQTYGHIQK